MRPYSPTPSPLARAVCQGLTGAPPAGFTLLEVALVCGGLALLSTGAFVVYQSVANSADVRTEQDNVQQIGQRADRIQGVIGSYQGMTTADAVINKIPPVSMIVGTGLISRWSQPVLLEPTDIGPRTNAGLKITYVSVPPRACLKFVQAAGQGMYEVEIGGQSVFSHRPMPNNDPLRLEPALALARCANAPTPVAFTYFGGATGLVAMVNEPVSLPPRMAPIAPPPTAPPPAPPPVAPPPAPPAPGCSGAPSTSAVGSTPPGQLCTFIWANAPAPTCWTPMALCTPIMAPPPATPPPSTPPSTPPPSAPPPPPGVPCVMPAPSTENGAQTENCPAGTLTPPGAPTFPQIRNRTITYTCPDPFDAPLGTPGPWSSWMPTIASSCTPICVAPTPFAEDRAGSPNTRPVACAANYYGSQTQTQTTTQNRTTTYSCPGPTGPYTPNVGGWSAPGAPLGAWTTTSSSCAACPAPSSQSATEWAPRSTPCAAGMTGSHTWEEVRTHARSISYSCPAGTATLPPATYGGYGAWSWTGTTRNVVNTCTAPTPPAVPAFDCLETPFPDTWAYLNPLGNGHAIRTHTYNAPKGIDRWHCSCSNGTTLTQVGNQTSDPFEAPFFSTYKLFKCTGTASAPLPAPSTSSTPYTRSWSSSVATCSATMPAGTSTEGNVLSFVDNTHPGVGVGRFQIYTFDPATIPMIVHDTNLGPNEIFFSWCIP